MSSRFVRTFVLALALAPVALTTLFAVSRLDLDPGFAPGMTSGVVLFVVFALALPFLRRADRAIDQVMFAREHGVCADRRRH